MPPPSKPNDKNSLKSEKYIAHRTLVSVGVLLTCFMIAWLKGWKDSIELCDTPDVNVFALTLTFGVALVTTIGIVILACAFLFVVEVVFVDILKLSVNLPNPQNGFGFSDVPGSLGQVIEDIHVFEPSLGFRIVIEWILNWRIVLVLMLSLAIAGAFGQGILLLLYIIRSESSESIASITFRRAVNVIYSFLLIIVISAVLLQVWCSSQKW